MTAVGIVTSLLAGRSRVSNLDSGKNLCSKTGRPSVRLSQPPIEQIPGFFSGDRAAGGETDYSSASSAEVKNEWRHTSFFSACFHDIDKASLPLPLPLK